MAATIIVGRVGGAAGDGGSLLVTGMGLSRLNLPTHYLFLASRPHHSRRPNRHCHLPELWHLLLLQSARRSVSDLPCPTSLEKLGVTPTSSMSIYGAMLSLSLPSGLPCTSPRVGQGRSCGCNALLANRAYVGVIGRIVYTCPNYHMHHHQ